MTVTDLKKKYGEDHPYDWYRGWKFGVDEDTDGLSVRAGGLTSNGYTVRGTNLASIGGSNLFSYSKFFFLKNSVSLLKWNSSNSASVLANKSKFKWGLYTYNGSTYSLKWEVPSTLPDGNTLESCFNDGVNYIQLETVYHISTGKFDITIIINGENHGTVQVSDTVLNRSQKHCIGFQITDSTNTCKSVDVTEVSVYSANLSTKTYFNSNRTDDRHFNTNEEITFTTRLKDEYDKAIVSEKVRVYCNYMNHVEWVTSSGITYDTTTSDGKVYYAVTTDEYNGEASFKLKCKDGLASAFELQAHKERDYLYNYSKSNPNDTADLRVKCYYRTQPTFDISNIPDEVIYNKNNPILNLHVPFLDNKGNPIIKQDWDNQINKYKIYQDSTVIFTEASGENLTNNITLTKPTSPNYSYPITIKWEFAENDTYNYTVATKTIIIRKPQLSVTLHNFKTDYYWPERVKFTFSLSVDDPSVEVPSYSDIVVRRNDKLVTHDQAGKENEIDNYVNENGIATYTFIFWGNDEIAPYEQDFSTNFHVNQTEILVTGRGGEVFIGQRNYVTVVLLGEEGYVSGKEIRATFTFKEKETGNPILDGNGNQLKKSWTENTDGNGSATLYCTYLSDDEVEATADVYIAFEGEGSYLASDYRTTIGWVKKQTPRLELSITNGEVRYPDDVELGVIFGLDVGDKAGFPIDIYRNDEKIGQVITDEHGGAYFIDSPDVNDPTDHDNSNYVYFCKFEGTEEINAHTSTTSTLWYYNYTKLKLVQKQTPIEVFQEENLKVQLVDGAGEKLYRTHIHVTVKGVKWDGSLYDIDHDMNPEVASQTIITDENGYAVLNEPFSTKVGGTYTFTFNFPSSKLYVGSSVVATIVVTRIKTIIDFLSVTDGDGNDIMSTPFLAVFEKCIIVAVLQRFDNRATIIDKPLKYTLTIKNEDNSIDKVIYNAETIECNQNGRFVLTHQQNEKGDVYSEFMLECYENDTYEYTKRVTSVEWLKLKTGFGSVLKATYLPKTDETIDISTANEVGGVGETETTLKGIMTVALTDEKDRLLKDKPVDTSVKWKTYTGSSNITVSGKDETGPKITNQYGRVGAYFTPTNMGDIIGTFTFTYDGDDCCYGSSYTNTIKWRKIKTEIIAENVMVYNGRYTNLNWGEPDWTKPSPGTNENYKNFHSTLKTKDTFSSYVTVPNATLDYVNYVDDILFTSGVVDSKGDVYSRWTRYYSSAPVTYSIGVKFNGNDLFKESRTSLTWEVLKRLQVYFDYTEDNGIVILYEGHETPRYNIPVKIQAFVVDSQNENMPGQTISIYWNYTNKNDMSEHKLADVVSNSSAEITYTFRPQVVGNIKLAYGFNWDDLIDKFESKTQEEIVYVDKDYPILKYTNLPKTFTKNCGNEGYAPIVKMFNSIDEVIKSNEEIYWFENIGDSWDGNCWEVSEIGDEKTRLFSDGTSENAFKSRSGVKLIKAQSTETWRYYEAIVISYLRYKLKTIYGASKEIVISGGIGETVVDCQLPLGLYDLKIEYVGPIVDGCQKYGSANSLYGVHRKKGTEFVLDEFISNYNNSSSRMEQEVTKQFEAYTVLKEEDEEIISNKLISTDVNSNNKLTQKTGEGGEAVRHHCDNMVNHDNSINFEYEQSRKQAGCINSFIATTIPLTPIFAYVKGNYEYFKVDDEFGPTKYYRRTISTDTLITITEDTYNSNTTIVNYMEVDFDTTVRVYYYKKHYDRYGEEIKKGNNVDVYHRYDSNGEDIYFTWDGKTKTTTTKSVYNSAESYNDFIPLKSAHLVWRTSNGDNVTMPLIKPLVPVETYTDNGGYGTFTYHRHTLGTANIYVHVEDDEFFNSNASLKLKLDTRTRLDTVITNKGKITARYGEKCVLDCTLKDENGNPLKDQLIRIKCLGNVVASGYTNSSGYFETEYTPTIGTNFDYQCIFNVNGIYNSTTASFKVNNDKQYPILTAYSTPTTLEYGSTLKVVARLTKSDGVTNLSIATIKAYLVDINETESPTFHSVPKILIGSGKTGEDGRVTITGQVQATGSYKVWCFFEGDKRSETNQAQIVSVNPYYHWAFTYANDGAERTLTPLPVELESLGENNGNAGSYGEHSVQLVDSKNVAVPNVKVTLKVTDSSGTQLIKKELTTNDSGECGLIFVNNEDKTSSNYAYLKIGSNNMGDKYKLYYDFNNSNASTSYDKYSSAKYYGIFQYEKGTTVFSPLKMGNEDYSFTTTLTCTETDSPVANVDVGFYKDGTLIGELIKTDSKGSVTLPADKINSNDEIYITAKFAGNSRYHSATKKGLYSGQPVEPCNDLSTFEKVKQVLYADPKGQNQAFINSQNAKVNGSTKTKKACCSQAKTNINAGKEGNYYDGKTGSETSECVGAIPGIALRSTAFVATTNCDITFQIKYVCNATNPRFFLGHFGLSKSGAKNVEQSRFRFESHYWVDGGKGYFIQNNNYNNVTSCEALPLNEWTDITFHIRPYGNTGKSYASCTFQGKTYTGSTGSSYLMDLGDPGYAPYIFVTSNDCEIRIRKITMKILKDSS